MKLITFNTWGLYGPDPLKRWAYAADCLSDLGPDILCLQEATDPEMLERVRRYTGLRNVANDCGKHGSGLAVLGRYDVKGTGLVLYQAKSPVENYTRKFLWAHFDDGLNEFLVVNTHLSWKPEDHETRLAQAAQLQAFVAQRNLPAVLCGDFNCSYHCIPLEGMRQAGFVDCLAGTEDEHRPSWDNANPYIQSHSVKFPDRRIDLVLKSPGFGERFRQIAGHIVLNRPSSLGQYASDHYGVLTRFEPVMGEQ